MITKINSNIVMINVYNNVLNNVWNNVYNNAKWCVEILANRGLAW